MNDVWEKLREIYFFFHEKAILCIVAAYKSMPDRVKDVIKNKGLSIYWIEFILIIWLCW